MLHTGRRLAAFAAGGLLTASAVVLVQAAPAHAGFAYLCSITESPDEEAARGRR